MTDDFCKSPSYKPLDGAECSFRWGATAEEPCWGQVEPVEHLEEGWIHACQGHIAAWDGGNYVAEAP